MLFAFLIPLGLIIAYTSYQKTKSNQFYSLTTPLAPLGIYVWGDGLILGIFWAVVGLASPWLTTSNLVTLFLLFHTIRSGYEVMYWLNHQSVKDPYHPPMPRHFHHLKTHESAIIYQLLHTCIVILCLFLLISNIIPH